MLPGYVQIRHSHSNQAANEVQAASFGQSDTAHSGDASMCADAKGHKRMHALIASQAWAIAAICGTAMLLTE